MEKNKEMRYLLVICFIVIICFPVFFINMQEGKISTIENRALASFPKIHSDGGGINPNLRSELGNWFSDNIGFRDQLLRLHSAIQLNVFRQSSSTNVQIGKDGWLYYTLGDNLKIAQGTYPLTDEMLRKIANNQEKIQQYCKQRGIEYVLVLPASKVSVYPEYVRGGNFTVRETPSDILTEYLEKNTSIHVIKLKDDLLEAKETKQVYFKTDTHWNFEGANVGYNAILKALNSWGITNSKPAQTSLYPSKHMGDLAGMLGDNSLYGEEKCLQTNILNAKAKRVTAGEDVDKLRNVLLKNNANVTYYLYHNDSIKDKKLLVYGDSMFASWGVTDSFAENFSDETYCWWVQMKDCVGKVTPDLLDSEKPDVFMYEVGERDITLLAGDY